MVGNLNSKEFNTLLMAVVRNELFDDTPLKAMTREEVLKLFRTFKLIELSMAAATGGISTRGIDAALMVKSKFKSYPYIRKKCSRRIQDFVMKNSDLCRSQPSEDLQENVRRAVVFFKAVRKNQQRTASSDN